MKAAVILSLAAAAVASVVERAAHCGGDNCARQVTGTRGGLTALTSRKNDCSSFMMTTVVPDASTVTVTVTVDPDEAPAKFRRAAQVNARAMTEVPSDVPAYASACSPAAEYSSACDCWGITAMVTTAPAPTSTVTSTVTQDYCEDL